MAIEDVLSGFMQGYLGHLEKLDQRQQQAMNQYVQHADVFAKAWDVANAQWATAVKVKQDNVLRLEEQIKNIAGVPEQADEFNRLNALRNDELNARNRILSQPPENPFPYLQQQYQAFYNNPNNTNQPFVPQLPKWEAFSMENTTGVGSPVTASVANAVANAQAEPGTMTSSIPGYNRSFDNLISGAVNRRVGSGFESSSMRTALSAEAPKLRAELLQQRMTGNANPRAIELGRMFGLTPQELVEAGDIASQEFLNTLRGNSAESIQLQIAVNESGGVPLDSLVATQLEGTPKILPFSLLSDQEQAELAHLVELDMTGDTDGKESYRYLAGKTVNIEDALEYLNSIQNPQQQAMMSSNILNAAYGPYRDQLMKRAEMSNVQRRRTDAIALLDKVELVTMYNEANNQMQTSIRSGDELMIRSAAEILFPDVMLGRNVPEQRKREALELVRNMAIDRKKNNGATSAFMLEQRGRIETYFNLRSYFKDKPEYTQLLDALFGITTPTTQPNTTYNDVFDINYNQPPDDATGFRGRYSVVMDMYQQYNDATSRISDWNSNYEHTPEEITQHENDVAFVKKFRETPALMNFASNYVNNGRVLERYSGMVDKSELNVSDEDDIAVAYAFGNAINGAYAEARSRFSIQAPTAARRNAMADARDRSAAGQMRSRAANNDYQTALNNAAPNIRAKVASLTPENTNLLLHEAGVRTYLDDEFNITFTDSNGMSAQRKKNLYVMGVAYDFAMNLQEKFNSLPAEQQQAMAPVYSNAIRTALRLGNERQIGSGADRAYFEFNFENPLLGAALGASGARQGEGGRATPPRPDASQGEASAARESGSAAASPAAAGQAGQEGGRPASEMPVNERIARNILPDFLHPEVRGVGNRLGMAVEGLAAGARQAWEWLDEEPAITHSPDALDGGGGGSSVPEAEAEGGLLDTLGNAAVAAGEALGIVAATTEAAKPPDREAEAAQVRERYRQALAAANAAGAAPGTTAQPVTAATPIPISGRALPATPTPATPATPAATTAPAAAAATPAAGRQATTTEEPMRGEYSLDPIQAYLDRNRGVSLKKGSNDRAAVTELQKFLISNGYLEWDGRLGTFGTLTHNAVMAFQRANGLNPDGRVGGTTLDAMMRSDNAYGDQDDTGLSERPRRGTRTMDRGNVPPATSGPTGGVPAPQNPTPNPPTAAETARAATEGDTSIPDVTAQRLSAAANQYARIAYEDDVSNAAASRQFDCSNYVATVLRDLGHPLMNGDNMATVTDQQYAATSPIPAGSEPRRGDLVFFRKNDANGRPKKDRYGNTWWHVAIYDGDGMIYDSGPSAGVSRRRLSAPRDAGGYNVVEYRRVR